jgi:hypothetical protein
MKGMSLVAATLPDVLHVLMVVIQVMLVRMMAK